MFVLWIGAAGLATHFELNGNPRVEAAGVSGHSGNLEGKEVRFGAPASGLFAASTTGTSTGAVNSSHDSFTPLGGAVPLVNMMLGEVSPGGVGAGLYGMLIFALLSVFIAGLMVGRTPEYLGKKIQATEMKLVVLYILIVPALALGFSSVSDVIDTGTDSILIPARTGSPRSSMRSRRRRTTYASTSPRSARSSSPIRRSRGTSSRKPGWATGSSRHDRRADA
jgi:potassium-transporting ATPase potassium-binding subunit